MALVALRDPPFPVTLSAPLTKIFNRPAPVTDTAAKVVALPSGAGAIGFHC